MSELHLTRLTVRRDASAAMHLLQALTGPDGGAAMASAHRLMWEIMPTNVRQKFERAAAVPGQSAFLWRDIDAGRKFYVLGPRPIDASPIFEIETKPFTLALRPDDRLAFDLRVHATVDRKTGTDATGRAIRTRRDVAFDRILADEAHLRDGDQEAVKRATARMPAAEAAARDWLIAQGKQNGFRLETMTVESYRLEQVPRAGKPARIGVFDLKGILSIEALAPFAQKVEAGFGRAKAFGCGLMLLRRAPLQ